MNIQFDDKNGLETITNSLCAKGNGNIFKIKDEYGTGSIYLKRVNKNVSLLFFDFNLNQPVIAKWDFKTEHKNQYFLLNNLSNAQDVALDSKSDLLEEGAIFFTQNNVRRRLWLPNIHHTAIAIEFNDEWLKGMNQVFPLSKQSSSFIDNSDSIYLNSNLSSSYRLVLKQIYNLKELEFENNSLIELKILEMVFHFFDDAFSNVSISKKNLTIHPDDLSKMTNYINTFNDSIDMLPTLKEASDVLGMSESKFQRLFKKIFRKTYYSYILELKMNFALELLMGGAISVSTVAAETGYSSLSNFTIAFKRYFKYLPSDV